MKILLIYPPATLSKIDPTSPGAIPPLGLAYIAAYLRENGYNVEILDALGEGIELRASNAEFTRIGLSDKQIKRRIETVSPDIVGISCHFTAYASDAHQVARIAKEVNSDILTVMGGVHANVAPYEVLKDHNVNLIVSGEGEITTLELVKTLEKGEDFRSLPGTIVQTKDTIIRNPPRPLIKNLDILPFPARDLLPMRKYFEWKKKCPEEFDMLYPSTPVVTSRGCPMSCIYCAVQSVWGRNWRARSATAVVDEIELIMDEYGIREVQFIDDNMTLDRKRMFRICDEILRRRLDIKWCTPNGVAIWTLNEELLKKMKQAGCYRLSFGIESGCSKTQQFIRKNIDLDRARLLIRKASNLGIWTVGFFIIGFPYETAHSIMRTIRYAIDSDLDFATFYLPMPFPGTDLLEIIKKEDLLEDSNYSSDILALSAMGGCPTKYFSVEQLREFQKYAYKLTLTRKSILLLNPIRTAKKVCSLEEIRYFLKILSRGIRMKVLERKHSHELGFRPISFRTERGKASAHE